MTFAITFSFVLLATALLIKSSFQCRCADEVFRAGQMDYNCQSKNLTQIPTGCKNVHKMDIENNRIGSLYSTAFDKEYENVTYLHISNNSLHAIGHDSFNAFKKLRTLSLHRNNLMTLHENLFFKLKSLRELRLGFNKFQNIHSGAFKGLTGLEDLYLESCEIAHLDDTTFDDLQHLRVLHLQNNHLKAVNRRLFQNLTKLQFLHLENNSISQMERYTFRRFHKLEELYLNDNELNEYDLADELFQMHDNEASQIRILNLSHNQITKIRSKMFTGLEKAEVIDLRGNPIEEIETGSFPNFPSKKLILNDCHNLTANEQLIEDLNELFKNQKELEVYMTGPVCEAILQDLEDKSRLRCDQNADSRMAERNAEKKTNQVENIFLFGGVACGVLLFLILFMTVVIVRGRKKASPGYSDPPQQMVTQPSFPGNAFYMGFIQGTRISRLASRDDNQNPPCMHPRYQTKPKYQNEIKGRPYPPVQSQVRHPGCTRQLSVDPETSAIVLTDVSTFNSPQSSFSTASTFSSAHSAASTMNSTTSSTASLLPRPVSNYGDDIRSCTTHSYASSPSYITPNTPTSNTWRGDCRVQMPHPKAPSEKSVSQNKPIVISSVTSSGYGQKRTKFSNLRSSFRQSRLFRSAFSSSNATSSIPAEHYIKHGDVMV